MRVRRCIALLIMMTALTEGAVSGNTYAWGEILEETESYESAGSCDSGAYEEEKEETTEELEGETASREEEKEEGSILGDLESIGDIFGVTWDKEETGEEPNEGENNKEDKEINREEREENTSGSGVEIERYEIDEGELSEEAKGIIEARVYGDLNHGEKTVLNDELGLREDTMEECGRNGLSVRESIARALIMQRLEFDFFEAGEVIESFRSERKAEEETLRFKECQREYLFMNGEETRRIFKEYLKKGYETERILNGYAVSWALGIEIEEAVRDYEEGSGKYTENEEKITAKKEELGIADLGIELAEAGDEEDWTSAEAYNSNLRGMFDVIDGINEAVSYGDGTLRYEDEIMRLPGRNGLDINLSLIYKSGKDEKETRHDFGCFRISRTRLMSGEGTAVNPERGAPGRIQFSDGSIYSVNRKRDGTLKIMYYGIKSPELKEDNNAEFPDSAYSLKYYDKEITEYFNERGGLVGIKDYFGNKIKVSGLELGESDISEVTYEDTIGRKVTIVKSGNDMTVTKPDGRQIKYVITGEGSGKVMTKTDENGNRTVYKYRSVEKSKEEYSMTEITYPTGARSVYVYEKVPGSESERLREKYRVIDGKERDRESFAYSGVTHNGYNSETGRVDKTYDYYVQVTDGKGLVTKHTYDEKHLNIEKEIKTEGYREIKRYRYEYIDKNRDWHCERQPVRIDTERNGVKTYELLDYDFYGHLREYWGRFDGNIERDYNSEYYAEMIRDPKGVITSNTYKTDSGTKIKEYNSVNDKGKVTESRVYENETLKSRTAYGYDCYGNMTSKKEYTGGDKYIETVYGYDGDSTYLTEVKEKGVTRGYTYDTLGRVTSETDGNGNVTRYGYNAGGDVVSVSHRGKDGKSVTSERREYNYALNDMTVTDGNGGKRKYDFNGGGDLVSVTDVRSGKCIERYEYDSNGRVTGRVKGERDKEVYSYDGLDRTLTRKSVKITGNREEEDYNEVNAYWTENDTFISQKTVYGGKTGAENLVRRETRDKYGNVIKSVVNGIETSYENDYTGRAVKEREGGIERSYKYDYKGNVIREEETGDGIKRTVTAEYGMRGEKTKETDPMGNSTEYKYDGKSGRLREVIRPFSGSGTGSERYEYDGNGNVTRETVRVTGSLDRIKETSYNYMNKPVRVTGVDDDGKKVYTAYEYDKNGNTIKVITGNGKNVMEYKYDGLDRVIKITYPSGKSETYEYDAEGNVSGKTDRNGVKMTYEYNSLGKVTLEKGEKGRKTEVRSYEYAGTGAVTRMTNENTEVSYTYNSYGLPAAEKYKADGVCYMGFYTYDGRGNRKSFKLYQGKVTGFEKLDSDDVKLSMSYEYDGRNRMTAVRGYDWEGKRTETLASYAYDLNGNRIRTAYGNGIVTEYTYNKANLVTGLMNKRGGTVVSSYNYEYNYDGNQIKKSDNKGNVTSYTYDGLGRLKCESLSSRTAGTLIKSYGYDMSGNRKSLTVTGRENYVTEYTYDADNRLDREKTTYKDGNIDVSDYLYDGNGNQIKRIKGKSKAAFRGRTALGIKTEEELKGEYEIREYGLFNQLREIRDGRDRVSYSYKPDGLRLSKTVNGVRTGFVWDNGNIIETTDGDGNPTGIYKYGLGRVSDNKGNYYIYNAHGDVTGLTDSAGNMVREYEYGAFGMEVNKDSNDTNPFRYCGEYYDNETESIYLRARNYDPGTGRFTSEDPARDGLNWYVYCGNNPVAFADPFGMIPTRKEAAEMASHIYKRNDSDSIDDRSIRVNGKETGWILIQVKRGREGMKMGIYAKTDKTHSWRDPLEYALVFKGTDEDSFSDWKNNAEQYLSSRSADMWDALGAANSFVTDYPGREVTFVGHSKGGAEAIAAVYKNKAAITFNPMVANLEDYVKDYKKRIRNYNASMMTNYVIKGDGLNGLFGENEVGKTVYEATQLWLVNEKINLNSLPYYDIMSQFTGKNYEYSIQIADPIGNHSIDLFR